MSNSPVGVRIATADDLRFVASTWFRSVLESNTVVNQIPFNIFREGMEANIQRLLKRSTTRVVFATSQPDELLGYVVLADTVEWKKELHQEGKAYEFEASDRSTGLFREPITVVHHVYVKSAYRRQGIGRSLVGEVKTFTHPATPGAGKKFALALGLSYNPRLG